MQTTSETFNRILSKNHRVETNVTIGSDQFGVLITEGGDRLMFGLGEPQTINDGHDNIISYPRERNIQIGTTEYLGIVIDDGGGGSGYGEDMIVSVETNGALFSGGHPTIGEAFSAEIDLKMIKPAGFIPKMAKVSPWVKLVGEDEESEWVQKGTFYIDTREYTDDGQGTVYMEVHGYDAMLKAEELFPLNCPLYEDTGTATDIDVVHFIADMMDIKVDPRTDGIMTRGYTVMRPTDYTMREVLKFIAGMYAGNFIISDAAVRNEEGHLREQLRLVPLRCIPDPTQYLIVLYEGEPFSLNFGTAEEVVRILV